MTMTYEELVEKLNRLDVITIVELLNIDTEDILNRFQDMIELRQERLEKEVE